MIASNAHTDFRFNSRIALAIHKPPLSRDVEQEKLQEIKDNRPYNEHIEISIVVVAYNEKEDLIDLVDCLERQLNIHAEIIVVDNGLAPAISKYICSKKILYIKAKSNLGCCGGRNFGASLSTGRVLLFVDADGRIEDDLIRQVGSIMTQDVIAARGIVKPKNMDLLTQSPPPSHYDLGDYSFPHHTNTEGISAWNAALFKEAGGFEESLYGYEGPVLNYRLYELFGAPASSFIYSPQMVLYHDYSTDPSHLEKKVRDRMILKEQVDLRYPLLSQLINRYKEDRPNNTDISQDHGQHDTRRIRRKLKKERKASQQTSQHETVASDAEPAFSVIIPCFNLGRFLLKAIESVEQQTLKPVEIIVVDDASTDQETIQILNALQLRVAVIRLQKNSGVSVARNTGITAAKARLILCLDADDTISRHYLEMALNVFELNDKIGMVSTWVQMHGQRNTQWKPKDRPALQNSLLTSPLPIATCFRKEAWEKTGRGFDPRLRGYEDWDFWLSIMELGYEARVIPSFNFYYFTRPDSKVHDDHRNAYAFTKTIVENHMQTYLRYMPDVIARQREINETLKQKIKKSRESRKSKLTRLRSWIARLIRKRS